MRLDRIELHSFRSYSEAVLVLSPGLTVLVGENGSGKTNILEAVGYLANLRSFRGAPTDALIRLQAPLEPTIVRGFGAIGERRMEVETEIVSGRRNRTLINKQPVKRARETTEALQITVFSPDDLVLVKGGPGERRDYLDDLGARLHLRNDAALVEFDRILKQRNALLKQCGGRLDQSAGLTLDVWDAKLATSGEQVAAMRHELVASLAKFITDAYGNIADRPASIGVVIRPSWQGPLADALAAGRNDDVRRGLSLLGPHRDDVELLIEGRASRTHASQGEQRSLSLALRLAGHRLLAASLEATPLLILDDVFSELDPIRSDALIRHLPPGQSLLATAGALPASAQVETVYKVTRQAESGSQVALATLADIPA